MKTKFSPLIKIEQQKVEMVERELLDVQNQLHRLGEEIEKIVRDIHQVQKPQSGDFSELRLTFSYIENLMQQKKEREAKVVFIKRQIEGLKELYKEANFSLEKVTYLHAEAVKKIEEAHKIEVQKEMDEIANLLFLKRRQQVRHG